MAENVVKERVDCPVCRKKVGDRNKAISCDVCETWVHISCAGISDSVYKELVKLDEKTDAGLHWFCGQCNGEASKMLKSLVNLKGKQEKMEEELELVKADIAGLKTEMSKRSFAAVLVDGASVSQGEVRNEVGPVGVRQEQERRSAERELQLQVNEAIERDKRKTKLIIMGIAEEENDDTNSKDKIEKLIQVLVGEMIEYEIVERVGKKGEKTRPIRINIENVEDRRMMLKKARTLRDNKEFERVYVVPDMTRQQQDLDRKLREKLKSFKQQGESNAKIVWGEVVKFVEGRKEVLYSPSNN